jgi:hypothetical protein
MYQWCRATEKIIKRARMLANLQLKIGRRPSRSVTPEDKFRAVEAHEVGVSVTAVRAWCLLAERVRKQMEKFEQPMSSASNNDKSSGSPSAVVNLVEDTVNIVQPTKDASDEAEVRYSER